jgi:site-specific recombinase XerD
MTNEILANYDGAISFNDINEIAKQTLFIEDNITHDCNNERLQKFIKLIQQYVIAQRATNALSNEMDKVQIDVKREIKRFIKQCSKSNSNRTRQIYEYSISTFIEYLSMTNKDILHATTIDADSYINYLNGEHLSANTIRSRIAGIRCLYTYLSRHYECIKNIFVGVKIPRRINAKLTVIPSKCEMKSIIDYIKERNEKLACIVELISLTGLRCGAFANMTVYRSGKFSTITKGKQFVNKFDKHCMTLIRNTFGTIKHETCVFNEINTNNIKRLFMYYTKQMYDKQMIDNAYSLHKLRHYYATNEYKANHDIVKLSQQLNHSSIGVTGMYLTTLKREFD